MDVKKKIIAFDFFGVICSEVAPIWFEHFFPKEKACELKDRYLYPADVGKVSLDSLLKSLEELVDIPLEQIKKDWFSLAKVNNEVVSVIRNLQKNFQIVLFSNAPSSFIRQILKENNLENLFQSVIISSEIGFVKPNPDFFKKALDIIDVPVEKILFIDDNQKNTEAAEKLGIQSIVFKGAETLKSIKIIE